MNYVLNVLELNSEIVSLLKQFCLFLSTNTFCCAFNVTAVVDEPPLTCFNRRNDSSIFWTASNTSATILTYCEARPNEY